MGKKKDAPVLKQTPMEIRTGILEFNRNQRDTILLKWRALEESVKSEDVRREKFLQKRIRVATQVFPPNIQKFLGSLKKAVHKTIRDKGGTPFSILHQMFIYWNTNKSGAITSNELRGCMCSLGIIMTQSELDEVVAFYDSGKQEGGMDYTRLLEDIQRGEPSLIAFVDKKEEVDKDENQERFEEVHEKYKDMPPVVKQFVEATQNYVAIKMRDEGGTPYFHVRHLFQFYDYTYSNGLAPSELKIAATKAMNLAITIEQANSIIAYYDRKNAGQMECDIFLPDVVAGMKPILHFTELTPRRIARAKASIAVNPFIPKPFHAPSNKVLEKFKRDVKLALVTKVNSLGGSVKSWIREAFVHWDPMYTRKISHVEHLIGAAKRLGLTLSTDEASCLMACYDRFGTGEMNYEILTQELMDEDPHFLADSTSVIDLSKTATSRTPGTVTQTMRRLKRSADTYSLKSKGKLQARDLLHGTFVRFDPTLSGSVDGSGIGQVYHAMRTPISETEIVDMIKWFDCNGNGRMNYNELIRQIFGEDVSTRTLCLPRLGLNASGTVTMATGDLDSSSVCSVGSMCSLGSVGTMSNSAPLKSFSEKNLRNLALKNLQVIESRATKAVRAAAKRKEILTERALVESKISAIDVQRRQILQAHKLRHPRPKW